jgi:hypothetical protein
MRRACARAVVAAIFIVFHVASGAVAAVGACCHPDEASGPAMECCLKGGANHICPYMAKRTRTRAPGGEVKSPCAAGHDAGVPVSGFVAPPPAITGVPLPPVSTFRASLDAWPPVSRDLHPPSPPPKA